MKSLEPEKSRAQLPGRVKRKSINVGQENLVATESFFPDSPLPLIVRPTTDGLNLVTWVKNHRDFVENQLIKHGALLFRHFDVHTIADFEQFIKATSDTLLEYRERSSPRSQVGGNIYTSTDYPAEQKIFLHNENSYQHTWPRKIYFFCITPAQKGGETPIANVHNIYTRLDASIIEKFERKKWLYVRNLGGGIGLPWQTVFQTTHKHEVEAYCKAHLIEFEWKDDDRLRISSVRQAITTHPRTDEKLWFNHATFFHVSTLEPTIRDALLETYKKKDLPANSYYGDGSSIEPDVLDKLRDAYLQEEVVFPWEKGDILMVDNMLVAHGRASFVGLRKVVVGMSEPMSL